MNQKKTMVPTWLGLVVIVAATWLIFRVSTGGEDMSVATPISSSPTVEPVAEKPSAADQKTREIVWMERGKDAAKAKLKDPDSAEFRNVYFHHAANGVPMTCGEVNSKNSFGGYGGFQKFMSAGRSELTFLAEQMDGGEFAKVWNQMCAG